MIVYSENKGQFVLDVRTNIIATKILNSIREKGLNAGNEREFASWHNSMKFMRDIVDDTEIDDNVQIAIEYNIPKHRNALILSLLEPTKKVRITSLLLS